MLKSSQDKAQVREAFSTRLERFAQSVAEEAGDKALLDYAQTYRKTPGKNRSAISTELMKAYKTDGSNEAFALLYELNHEDFLRLIYHHLQRVSTQLDAFDILQEVFLNIYRYPHKFKPDRKSSFHNWSSAILRNSVLLHGRKAKRDRMLSFEVQDEEQEANNTLEPADLSVRTPYQEATAKEEELEWQRAWFLYLGHYLNAFRALTPREKRVLHMVEVDKLPYAKVAEKMQLRLENLKMLVYRSRKKIHATMKRRFQAARSAYDRHKLFAPEG